MAMLRNLRNLIKAGISPKHHNLVLRRLADQVHPDYKVLNATRNIAEHTFTVSKSLK